ncbi:MAG: ParB N-terminal domain-containing protein [Acidobacteriota bacterium]
MSHDFDRARRAAFISDVVRLVRREPTELLDFDEVQERLQLRGLIDRGLREIPLDRIVGTLGRAREFNRLFLPRQDSIRERWRRVAELAEGALGFPPIEVYKVGDAYFVIDGHHRVSVARRFGAETIEAFVKEFETRVPLSPADSAAEVLRKEGYARFLEATRLEPRDEKEFITTIGNGYERLLEHISVHRYYLGLDRGYPIAWKDAVTLWYQDLYRPVIDLIEQSGVCRRAEGTETDLYLYVMDHLHQLREHRGQPEAGPEQAVEALSESRRAERRLGRRVRSWLGAAPASPGDSSDDDDSASDASGINESEDGPGPENDPVDG